MKTTLTSKFKWWSIVVSVLVFLFFILFVDFGKEYEFASITAGIALMMAILWLTEAIPLAATSLLPLILFPVFGIISGKDISQSYINSTILLFLGGFLIAVAMEKWNLHKRISLSLISKFGKGPSQIILGFMAASAFISMWISNTATAVMLLPIGLAVVKQIESDFGRENSKNFSIALMLSIAYACSIGGVATIIGTPPNLVFQRIYHQTFPNLPEITFSQWMFLAIPLTIIMLIVVWLLLTKFIFPPEKNIKIDIAIIKNERKNLGKFSSEERIVSLVFLVTALLWIFRQDITIGNFIIPGWSSLLPTPKFIDDGTIAIGMSFILFMLPGSTESRSILELRDVRKVPWEIILLFGGGFALAHGFVATGLSDYLASQLQALKEIPVILLIFIVSFSITFLTELTSNTATAQIILPILAAISIELNIDPAILMIPATISASMAFMMPVATPPNAIVFGSDRLQVKDMARAGIYLNLIGAVLITIYIYIFFG